MESYIPRFFKKPDYSFFLFGPRGTGKSTYLKQNFPQALWVDLLKPEQFRRYSANPERIIELVEGNPEKKTIIIDEVQKVPHILDAIHYLIEEQPLRQFILTGSSARKLRRSGTDLLAGRVINKTFFPFIMSEISGIFSFEHIFNYGSIPVVLSFGNPKEALDAYVSLYIREEVQQGGFVRNIGGFHRFLESISFSHGSLLNISNVARDCQVERKVVEGYIKILEDFLIAVRIPVFSKRAKRALVQHPKFYFFDVGVFRAFRPKGPFDRPEEINGAVLEGLILQHLTAWNTYNQKKLQIYFWRSRGGLEVDFILYGEAGVFAIEVKHTNKIRREDIKSLLAFKKDYPESTSILLYNGNERLLIDDVLCLPCENFLYGLVPGKSMTQVIHNV